MAKGGTFEREIARVFTKWMTGERNPPQLWRSTQSGGWKHSGDRHTGDLCPNGPLGEAFCKVFSIECKHRHFRELDFWFEFSRAESPIAEWWTKISREAEEVGTEPVLVIRRNNYPVIIGLQKDGRFQGHVNKTGSHLRGLTVEHLGVTFYDMEGVLESVDFNDLMQT